MSRDLRIALVLLVLAAVFRLPGLSYPTEEYFDEVYHAKTARQYLEGESPTEWVHPPTAKLLIAVGVWLFGYKPSAWRIVPAIAGSLLAPVFYLFARRVLQTERAALLASVLLLADGVYLVQSRIAMTNIFAVLFQVAAAFAIGFWVRASMTVPESSSCSRARSCPDSARSTSVRRSYFSNSNSSAASDSCPSSGYRG